MKASISTLPWKALLKVGELKSQSENGKHKDNQPWQDFVTYDQCKDALARHVGELCAGKTVDSDSNMLIETHIALRALMCLELQLDKNSQYIIEELKSRLPLADGEKYYKIKHKNIEGKYYAFSEEEAINMMRTENDSS